MLAHLATLMAFQLAGEAAVAVLGLPFPGPLAGLLLLLAWLQLRGSASEGLARVGATLIDHLGLLFVPAGAAVIGFGSLLHDDGLAIAAAIVFSTAIAIVLSGLIASAGSRRTSEQSPRR